MTVDEPRAVAFNALKGGVGKTTIVKNTAVELGRTGADVLAVDLDDNGHLSRHLGYAEEFKQGLHLGDAMQEKYSVEKRDLVYETEFGFDFMPSTADDSGLEAWFKSDQHTSEIKALKNHLVDPWLGSRYDYILFDTPANRSTATKNAMIASGNIMIPLASGRQFGDALDATFSRIVNPLNKKLDSGLRVLALVPNMISDRLDQNRPDRYMLERINTEDPFPSKVPNFARIPEEVWTAIDNGKLASNPLPGIRNDGKLDNNKPLRFVDDRNRQNQHFEELAAIVINGEINRESGIADTLLSHHGDVSA